MNSEHKQVELIAGREKDTWTSTVEYEGHTKNLSTEHDSWIKIIESLSTTKLETFLYRKFEGQHKPILLAFSFSEFSRNIGSTFGSTFAGGHWTYRGCHRILPKIFENYTCREQDLVKFVLAKFVLPTLSLLSGCHVETPHMYVYRCAYNKTARSFDLFLSAGFLFSFKLISLA